jgi:hypothetical protein
MTRTAALLLAAALASCAQVPPAPLAPPGMDELGLDSPVEPIVAPVTFARGSMRRFERLCNDMEMTTVVQGTRTAQTLRNCGTVSVSDLEPSWERIAITVTDGPAAGATFAFERSAAGGMRGLAASGRPFDGATPAQRRQIDETLTIMSRLMAMTPPGRYPAGHVIEAAERVPGHDMTITARCTLAGRSRLGGREVAMFKCDGTSPFSTRDAASGVTMTGTITQSALMAVDTETTVTLRSASRLQTFGTAQGRPGTGAVPVTITMNFRGRLD